MGYALQYCGKYGLVPKMAMPESVSSSATQEMVSYMTEKLREYACVLRKGYKAGKSMEQLKRKRGDDGNGIPYALYQSGKTAQNLYL